MSKESVERKSASKKKSKDLDSVLDAALDDLDEDEEEECAQIQLDEKDNAKANSGNKQKNKPKKTSRAKSKKRAENQIEDGFSEEDLAASLEDVMKSLLQAGEQLESLENEDEGAADEVLENLMKQMQAHTFKEQNEPPPPKTSQKRKKKQQSASSETTAQKTQKEQEGTDVDRTVAKLLDDMAKANAASTEATEAANFDQMGEQMMESMMSEMQNMAEKEDADDVIDGMMRQLLSKELMYQPMKQVTEKFPKWLAESKDRLSEEDYNRYGHQYQYFQRIVAVYETDPENFPRLMELMQDIQEYGQPPAEIIKELAPGLEFDEEGMPKMDGQLPGMPFPGAVLETEHNNLTQG